MGLTHILDDHLARDIRNRKLSPDQALSLLRANKVLVYAAEPLDPDTANWGDVEDHGVRTGIHHALRSVGADDRLDEFSEEIVRCRDAGLTMESLFDE